MRLTTLISDANPRSLIHKAALILVAVLIGSCSINPGTLQVTPISLQGGAGSLSINEITYDESLNRVIVPGGDSGKVFLINPEAKQVDTIFEFEPGSSGGVVSVASGRVLGKSLLFVADRTGPALHVVDPKSRETLVSNPLKGAPEDVRFIHTTNNEIWVTEPDLQQIEILIFSDGNPPTLTSADTIQVNGGPVGLVYDVGDAFVYTNQPKVGLTSVFHAFSHELIPGKTWGNGCSQARGMALEKDGKYLFVACQEGKLVMVDLQGGGVQVASSTFGDDLNQVNFDPQTGNIYLPSGGSAIMGVFKIVQVTPTPEPTPTKPFWSFLLGAQATATSPSASQAGPKEFLALQQIGSADTALDANCVTSDKYGNVWVCDPKNGQILWVQGTNYSE